MRRLEGHTRYVESVAFAPDGASLATGSADGTARVWRTNDGKCVETLNFAGTTVGAVGFSPDEGVLAVGTYGGLVCRHDLANSPPRVLMNWEDQGRIVAVHYSADGRWFGWASYHKVVVANRRRGYVTTATEAGPNQFCLRFAPDGETFARGGESPQVLLCHSDTGAIKHRLKHGDDQGCWSLGFSADGRALVMALGSGMQVWGLPERKLMQEVRLEKQDDGDYVVSCIALSADGTRLITGSWDKVVRVYTFEAATRRVDRLIGEYNWKLGKLFDVALSPDGTLAAAGGHDGAVLWDVE
jgi:WD40 repeat protein